MSEKKSSEIIKWGKIKPYFDKTYQFNSVDIETVDNELFIFGCVVDDKYKSFEGDFYKVFHDLLIYSLQTNRDILTWSRYDNTHLLKLILSKFVPNYKFIDTLLTRIEKVSPIVTYKYENFEITLENMIRDCLVFTIRDHRVGEKRNKKGKRIVFYNLKNLFTSDLEKTAKSFKIEYYSKMGEEYHIINKKRFNNDLEYKKNVLLSNELDCRVIIDIAYKFLDGFKELTGVYPKSIFTAGSVARSYLLAQDSIPVGDMNFNYIFGSSPHFEELLDYSMRAYHGGKIESYVLGYIKEAKTTDLSSAYPFAISELKRLTGNVYKVNGKSRHLRLLFNKYTYAFIRCDVTIHDPNFIHPLSVKSPFKNANISPYGYIKDIVITKIEYDFLIENNIEVTIHDVLFCESTEEKPYHDMIHTLFNKRLKEIKDNPSLAEVVKTILNSLYGIKFELTDTYDTLLDQIEWIGYRAGDFFNPVEASYITAQTRTMMSRLAVNVLKNNGEVYLIMTDSLLYKGEVTLDVFTEVKTLGTYEPPTEIKDIVILGAGRYEYYNEVKEKFTIKTRGFEAKVKDKTFYRDMNLNGKIKIGKKTFVSPFKAHQQEAFNLLGWLVDDSYEIDPFNLGGKRIINNPNVNLNKEFTWTSPIYLDKDLKIKLK